MDALQIIFYYDDAEICNPLGSKRLIHKIGRHPKVAYLFIQYQFLGLFYYTLGNLSPRYRSKLSNIQLLAVAKTEHIKKYSMNSVIEPILKDIKKLVSCISSWL